MYERQRNREWEGESPKSHLPLKDVTFKDDLKSKKGPQWPTAHSTTSLNLSSYVAKTKPVALRFKVPLDTAHFLRVGVITPD